MTTDQQNDFIRQNFSRLPNAEIAQATGLGTAAVEHRARQMGVRKDGSFDTLRKALEDAGIDPIEVGRVRAIKLSKWEMGSKDADGNPQITPLQGAQFVLDPSWKNGPEWPVIQQAKPAIIKPVALPKRQERTAKIAVVLPDPQIGFRRDEQTGELDPFHDEQAMSVALKVIRELDPDLIVNLGDFIDLPEFGTYEQEAAFQRTTQAAIDRGYRFLVEQKANAPHAEIRLIEGNHDRRIIKAINRNALAAFGLRRAETPASWPVLSIPFLLRLDELGIQYVDGYPAGHTWINDRLKCVHGHIVRSGGSTARAVSDDERVSTIFGHIHRIEMHYKSVNVKDGVRTNLAISPGCLCRIDGAVPSAKGSTDLWGKPVISYENWQQGLAVVTYEEGDAPFAVEPVYINGGTAFFRGQRFTT